MMPYIPQDRRAVLDAAATPSEKGRLCNTAGEMNYCFVKIWMAQTPYCSVHLLERDVVDFMCALWHQKPKYETANAIVGAYLLALREIHRRTHGRLRANVQLLHAFCEQHLDEYEHAKIRENGDLPEFAPYLAAAAPAKAPAKKGRPGAKRRTPGRGHRNKKWRTAK